MIRALLLLAAALTAMGADTARMAPPWEKPRERARYLYLENCSVCHTLDKPKSVKIGPSLLRFRNTPPERMKAFRQYIELKIRMGGVTMPAFSGWLSDEHVALLADYVLGSTR